MIPATHTRHVCCVYVITCMSLYGFRDLSCDLEGGLLYTKWPLDVRSLGASQCDCSRLCPMHTLLYDRARPRPRLSDRAGVSLCVCYEIVDSMVEATCLRIWEFTTHIV